MSIPNTGVEGPGALVCLEDDPRFARMLLHKVLPPVLGDMEVAWVDNLETLREAITRWPRIAGFLLDHRIGEVTSDSILRV